MKKTALFSLFALLFFAISASAQITGMGNPSIVVKVTPTNPKPGDTVSISLVSSAVDLDASQIAWFENDELIKGGLGEKKYSTVAGQNGSFVEVTAVVRTADEVTYEYFVPIRPAVVDIVWEARSTVPPFYKGKALYSKLGTVKLIALPSLLDENGEPIDSRSLVYTWKRGEKVLGSSSGVGKAAVLINDNIYRTPFTVSVVAATPDYKYVAEGQISIDAVMPFVSIYESNPIYGVMFNKAISNVISISSTDATFEAFPFFFDAENRFDPSLVYSWSINYNDTGKTEPFISLKREPGSTGEAKLYLEVRNESKFFEGATADLNLRFGQ